MILLDLALQGFRDLSGSMRVRLQSGYNALVCPSLSGETLVQGLLVLLFSGADRPAAKAKKSGGGVSLMATDGTTLRAVRDFVLGTDQLLDFDRQSKVFKAVASGKGDVDAMLRSRLGLPSREAFEAVYVLCPRDVPSQAKLAVCAPEPTEPELPPPDPVVLQARLTELERILNDLKVVETLEFEIDGLQKQRFDCEDRIKALTFDDTELVSAEAEERRLAYLSVIPDDFLDRHQAYLKLTEHRHADLERWQVERETLDRAVGQAQVTALVTDPRLWGGLVVGVVAVVAAVVLGGVFRYIAFLDIPAFGLAALCIFKNLNEREIRDRIRRKVRLSDDRRDKITNRDAVEIKAVEGLLDKSGLSSIDDVRRALGFRDQVRERLKVLRADADQARQNPERGQLATARDAVSARINAIEAQLTGMSALPVDASAFKAEAESLRSQLDKIKAKACAEAMPVAPAEEKAPLAQWFRVAQDLLLCDPDAAARTLSERASLLIRALSGNRIVAVVFEPGGDVFMRTAQGGSAKWAAMPESARDLIYLALRGALYLALDPKVRAPIFTYDLAGVLAGGQDVEQALLSTLAQAGQLVHVVRRAEQAPKAKNIVTVEVAA